MTTRTTTTSTSIHVSLNCLLLPVCFAVWWLWLRQRTMRLLLLRSSSSSSMGNNTSTSSSSNNNCYYSCTTTAPTTTNTTSSHTTTYVKWISTANASSDFVTTATASSFVSHPHLAETTATTHSRDWQELV